MFYAGVRCLVVICSKNVYDKKQETKDTGGVLWHLTVHFYI